MKKVIAYTGILILFSCSYLNAQEKFIDKIRPDHVKVQFAGNIGLFSAGIGYSLWSGKTQTDMLYGYVPAFIGGNDVHTIANKNSFRLFHRPISKAWTYSNFIGFSLNYSITNDTYIFLPKQYPDGYYSANALHFAPFFSYNFVYANHDSRLFKKAHFYLELSTLDNYLWYCIKTNAIPFTEIWNLAIGTTIPLHQQKR